MLLLKVPTIKLITFNKKTKQKTFLTEQKKNTSDRLLNNIQLFPVNARRMRMRTTLGLTDKLLATNQTNDIMQ